MEQISTGTFSSEYNIIVPTGNYNANSLKAKVKSLLDTQFHANNVGANLATSFIITYDTVRNKFTFKTVEADRRAYIMWANTSNGLYRQLGFVGDTNVNFTTIGLESDAVVNVGGSRTDALYVRTNLGSNNSIESRIKGVSSILEKVPVITPPNSFIFWNSANVSSKILVPTKSIQSIQIRITDSDDRLINTNNINFTISIQFDTIETPVFRLPYAGRRFGDVFDAYPYLSNPFQSINEIRMRNAEERLRKAPKKVKVKKRDRKEEGNVPKAMSFENNLKNNILTDNIETK